MHAAGPPSAGSTVGAAVRHLLVALKMDCRWEAGIGALEGSDRTKESLRQDARSNGASGEALARSIGEIGGLGSIGMICGGGDDLGGLHTGREAPSLVSSVQLQEPKSQLMRDQLRSAR